MMGEVSATVRIEALREALADLPEKYRKLNLDAFELGLRLAQKV